jgi:replicative DNA helicase
MDEKNITNEVLGTPGQRRGRKQAGSPGMLPSTGRIPPQALEMEQAVLGALMLEKSAYDRLEGILKPEMFYKEGHKNLFEVVQYLAGLNLPIDLITVKNEMSKRGTLEVVGGIYYLPELTSKVASAANITYHAQVIAEKYMLREAIKIGDAIVTSGFDRTADPFMLLDFAADAVTAIRDSLGFGVATSVEQWKDQWLEALETQSEELVLAKTQGKTMIKGFPTGIRALDVITHGFEPGLYIFAARPGMGKTIYAINLLLELARSGKKVMMFSLEMSKQKLLNRMVSAMTGIAGGHVRTGNLSATQKTAIKEAINLPLWGNIIIDDQPGQSAVEIASKMRTARRKQGIDLVLIDYLGLIPVEVPKGSRGSNNTDGIGVILKTLRNTGRKIGIPVVGLSQVAREAENTKFKIPELRMLPDSKHYEQDADFVAFLYRPAYYNTDNHIRQHFSAIKDGHYQQTLFVIVAKNRDGEVGVTIPACVNPSTSAIIDIQQIDWLHSIGQDASWIYGNPEVMRYIGIDENRQMSIDEFDSNRGTKGGNESTYVVANDNDTPTNYDFPF